MRPLKQSSIHIEHVFKVLGIVVLVCGLVWYAHYQARNLINGPSIALEDVGDGVHHERTVDIKGVAKNIVSLSLNGKSIFTDEKDVFEHTLMLENGYTIMTINAEDRYGRKTSLSRTFVYVPAS